MLENQIVIKVLLIVVFAIFAIILISPVGGARRLAVRRLTLVLSFFAVVLAVVFPRLINDIANLLGVGRGTDLILYGLVVVFVGNIISSGARHRQLQREVTQLARAMAIQGAPKPKTTEPGPPRHDGT